MARFQDNSEQAKAGYDFIYNSIKDSKSIKQLTVAIERAIPLMQEFKLDDYQQDRLEQFGIRRYEQLVRENQQIEHIAKTNKIRK